MDTPPIIPTGCGQASAIPPKLPEMSRKTPPSPPLATAPKMTGDAPKPNTPQPAVSPKIKTRIALVAGISLLVLIGIGVFVNDKLCTPKNSILALASAIDRRDRETVEEYVDAPALAESLRRSALESYKRVTEKTGTNMMDRVFDSLFDQIAKGVTDVTYTPKSVIGILCGDAPTEAMKEGIANSSDKTVDAFTKDGTPKIKVYGSVGKLLIRWAAGAVIDEAAMKNQAKQSEFNPADYSVSARYETLNRYLITITHRNSDDPTIGCVFKRHGLATWKFSEVRLLPQQKNGHLMPLN